MSYIKKEPIIDFITKGLNNPNKEEAFGYDAISILTEIAYAPAFEEPEVISEFKGKEMAEVKHGCWSKQSKNVYTCSNCNFKIYTCMNASFNPETFKYCSNCGAIMEGGVM